MATHKRTELAAVTKDIAAGNHKQVYLCFGERYLCQQAADLIEAEIIQQKGGAVHNIDGSAEDDNKILSRLLSFSLLPGTQIYRVGDTRLFLSRKVGSDIWEKAIKTNNDRKDKATARHLLNLLNLGGVSPGDTKVFSDISPDQWQKLFGFSHPGNDLSWADRLVSESPLKKTEEDATERFHAALNQGFPESNVLILTAENVDKRKKLFTQLKKYGEVIDCSVASGSSRAAVTQQKDVITEMAKKTLAEFNKTIDPKALEILFERVGFHPVAVVMEMEKLALFVDDRPNITISDLNLMVSRTREDAIYELTEAFGKKNLKDTLTTLNHLINDGVHSLAILASLRNYLRKLLIFRSLQSLDEPIWNRHMNASEFQNRYLPTLKETGSWPDLLKGHPYALFMSFSKAAEFSTTNLKRSLELLLDSEFKLKGSPIPQTIILEELLISLIRINSRKAGI